MPKVKGNLKSSKRRRVRFSGETSPAPKSVTTKPLPRTASKDTEDAKWEATPKDSSESSLLRDASVNHAVTSFDLKKELREGKLSGEDGIVPTALVSDDGSSSSGDEIIPKKKRRRESDEEDEEDEDDDNEMLNLPDAIAAVVSKLKRGEKPVGMETPASRVLKSSNFAERTREDLLQLIPKWSLCWGAPETRIHGPFTTSEMVTWARARYFSQPSRIGYVRAEGGCKWSPACDVFPSDQNK